MYNVNKISGCGSPNKDNRGWPRPFAKEEKNGLCGSQRPIQVYPGSLAQFCHDPERMAVETDMAGIHFFDAKHRPKERLNAEVGFSSFSREDDSWFDPNRINHFYTSWLVAHTPLPLQTSCVTGHFNLAGE